MFVTRARLSTGDHEAANLPMIQFPPSLLDDRFHSVSVDHSEIAYGPPTTFRRNSDGCKAVRRNSVGIVQSQTAIQRSYIFVGNGHMVRRNSVGKYRRNSDDFAVNRNVVGNSSEYTDELPTTTTYSVTNVRRPWCPSEPPSEFGVFSCSVKPRLSDKLVCLDTKNMILLINTPVNLGLAYHFEKKIEKFMKDALEKVEDIIGGEGDMYTISIIFRVFRRYGHIVSSGEDFS
ncbi:hypothetical protein DY000_02022431 [Brassica cretica]|uniref:Terpene synthase N-terminal domain-containing protein n=1 Tax=Brassica cretica TaxID=69181 RepID=A0ABQ7EEX0_BRACR|nr:hypothetical protein DY000_02022431 [Brassica cretica]